MSETQAVLAVFNQYSQRFEERNPDILIEYLHQPVMLMDSQQVAVMHNPDEIKAVFSQLFQQLEQYQFHHSQLDEAQVSLLSPNQAQVNGVASRYREDNSLIQTFGFTYTLRKDGDNWKIIAGIIHDTHKFMLNEPMQVSE